jgi:hypothetical protein
VEQRVFLVALNGSSLTIWRHLSDQIIYLDSYCQTLGTMPEVNQASVTVLRRLATSSSRPHSRGDLKALYIYTKPKATLKNKRASAGPVGGEFERTGVAEHAIREDGDEVTLTAFLRETCQTTQMRSKYSLQLGGRA